MSSVLPEFMKNSKHVLAVVVDNATGVAHIEGDGDGDKKFISAAFSRYPNGQLVRVSYRDVAASGGITKKQVVGVTEINVGDSFVVALTSTNLSLEAFCKILKMKPSDSEKPKLEKQFKEKKFPVVVTESSDYRAADKYLRYLEEQFDGKAAFMVVKSETIAEDKPSVKAEKKVKAPEIVEWVDDHWVEPSMRPIFKAAQSVIMTGGQLNVLVTGPSGFGKTSTAQALAKWIGLDFYRVNCAIVNDTEQWFGYHEATGGSTVFIPTPFTELLEKGNSVLVLDEANRIEPWVANSLFPILDEGRATEVHGRKIKVGPGVVFFLTMNVGLQYSGTFTTDAAFLNRMDLTSFVDVPPAGIEKEIIMKKYSDLDGDMANKIVSLIGHLRVAVERAHMTVDVSTRTASKIAKAVTVFGLPIRVATELIIINTAQPDERKGLIDAMNVNLGKG